MNDPASFRDPAGVVFYEDGVVKRRINVCYMPQYRKLIGSGLYRELVAAGMLVPHRELPEESGPEELVIRPLRIPMISYPYEWSFGMLRDAALLTLRIHETALRYGMCLKDASAYNIQFIAGRPLLIDTLSFEVYQEGEPWCAYGQFCRHFLAPLLLMCHTDLRLNQLLRVYLDGIPLDLADRLLNGKGGWTARVHIRWHARAVQKHGEDVRESCRKRVRLPMSRQIAMIGSGKRGQPAEAAGDRHGVGRLLFRNELFRRSRCRKTGMRAEAACGNRSRDCLGFRSERWKVYPACVEHRSVSGGCVRYGSRCSGTQLQYGPQERRTDSSVAAGFEQSESVYRFCEPGADGSSGPRNAGLHSDARCDSSPRDLEQPAVAAYCGMARRADGVSDHRVRSERGFAGSASSAEPGGCFSRLHAGVV